MACAGATKFVAFAFLPERTAYYRVATFNPATTVQNTVLVGPDGACINGDNLVDSTQAGSAFFLFNDVGAARFFVGCYNDECSGRDTVSLQVSPSAVLVMELDVPQSQRIDPPRTTCTAGTEGCAPLSLCDKVDADAPTEYVTFMFEPTIRGVYRFSTEQAGKCKNTVMVHVNFQGKVMCDGDGGKKKRSVLKVEGRPRVPIYIYVGGYDNSCNNKFVAVTVSISDVWKGV
jgi:hypothetical protein